MYTYVIWPAASRIAAALLVGFLLHVIIFRLLSSAAGKQKKTMDLSLIRHSLAPTRILMMLIALLVVAPSLLPLPAAASLQQIISLLLITAVAWVLISVTRVLEDVLDERYRITDSTDNLLARKVRTRVSVMRRILGVLIVIVAFAAMLMTFPAARILGGSLLASAGLVGLVGGLAARPVFANLIAGLQIALTQPIRIDDVVVVDGQWGWIEEIDMAFVVVRIWDLRRLILPLTHFVETPFENWTYKSADLLGYVHIYADYTLPADALRAELGRVLKETPLWDGKVWNLQVTGAGERTVQFRALFSAATSSNRWDLMVYVRERLVAYLKENHPDQLPRARVLFAPPNEGISAN